MQMSFGRAVNTARLAELLNCRNKRWAALARMTIHRMHLTSRCWRTFRRNLAGLFCASITVLAAFSPMSASAQCRPIFPYKDGWLGGDAAYSIQLPDGRSLWLFGDTLVGKKSQVNRSHTKFVSSSIAISTCDEKNGWSVRYFWKNQYGASPRPVFDSGTGKYKYWVQDGFAYQGKVYVSLAKVKDRPDFKLFSFEYIGADLARISNPSDAPQKWKIEYLPLANGKAYPGSTIVLEGEYAYFFALFEDVEHNRRPMLLTRVPLNSLSNPSSGMEYLDKERKWMPGLKPEDAFPVIEKGASEMTIRYHPNIHKWVAITTDPEHAFSNQIALATAPGLSGPWSHWQEIYEMPEMVSTTAGYDKDTFCYAAKEHIEFGSGNSLLVTYACNSSRLEKMVANRNIYVPRVVEIQLSSDLK